MTHRGNLAPGRRQDGIALATALIFLIVITVLGLATVRMSTTELRLSRNEQLRVQSLETSQAIVDAVITDPGNTPVRAGSEYTICFDSGDAGGQKSCPAENAGLNLDPDGGDTPPELFSKGVYAEVQRLEPELTPAPGRLMTSLDKFSTAAFSVRGQYSRTQAGLGSADIEQGLIKLVPQQERLR